MSAGLHSHRQDQDFGGQEMLPHDWHSNHVQMKWNPGVSVDGTTFKGEWKQQGIGAKINTSIEVEKK